MSDGDTAKAVGQRRHVARAQLQVARINPGRVVVAKARLSSPANAVILRIKHAADHQRAATKHFVIARSEIDIVNPDAKVATRASPDQARAERQLGFARRQLDVDTAGGSIQAAVAATAADDAQVIGFTQHNVMVSHRARRATVDHGERSQFGGQAAMNARGRNVERGIRRNQSGFVGIHIEHASHIQVQIGLTPACRCI